jgi:hypothetical protein
VTHVLTELVLVAEVRPEPVRVDRLVVLLWIRSLPAAARGSVVLVQVV